MLNCFIYLPDNFNNGEAATYPHAWLKTSLLQFFKGFTATKAAGGYVMADGEQKIEPVTIYQILFDDTELNKARLKRFAWHLCRMADQESVLVIIDNKPEFIEA